MSEPTLTDVLSAISHLQEQVRVDIAALRGEMTGLRGEMTGLREEVTSLHDGQDQIKAEQARSREEITSLRDGQDQIKTEQARFREELTRLRVDLMARMDRLQDDLGQLRDENFVNFARYERIGDRTSGSIAGFEKEISVIHRQIRTLQDNVRQLRGEH